MDNKNELFEALRELGVDVDKTVSRFMDNSDLYYTFLRRFPDEDRITPIKEAAAANDAEKLLETSHKLKGVTANLGMNELSAAADRIVKKVRNGSADGCGEDIRRVDELNEQLCGIIRKILGI